MVSIIGFQTAFGRDSLSFEELFRVTLQVSSYVLQWKDSLFLLLGSNSSPDSFIAHNTKLEQSWAEQREEGARHQPDMVMTL